MKVVNVLLLLMSLLWMQPTFVCAQNADDQTLTQMKSALESCKELYNQKKANFDKEKGSLPEIIKKKRQAVIEKLATEIHNIEEDIQRYIETNGISQTSQTSQTSDEKQEIWRKYRFVMLPNRILVTSDDGPNSKITECSPIYCLQTKNISITEAEDYVYGKQDKLAVSRRAIIYINDQNNSYYYMPNGMQTLIKDSILPYLAISPNTEVEFACWERDKDHPSTATGHTVAAYKDGVLKTAAQIKKEREQKEAEKAAALNKSIASFKKKYGFDPSIDNVRAIVKVGRSVLGVIDARNEWLIEYGNKLNQISVKLVQDNGASKCYEFYSGWGAFYCGYFWTRNDVITSIHWGR